MWPIHFLSGLCKKEAIEFPLIDPFSHPAEISYFRHGSFFKNTYLIFPLLYSATAFKMCLQLYPGYESYLPFSILQLGCVRFSMPISSAKIPQTDLWDKRVPDTGRSLASSCWSKGVEVKGGDWFLLAELPLEMLIVCKWVHNDGLSLNPGEYLKLVLQRDAKSTTQIARRKTVVTRIRVCASVRLRIRSSWSNNSRTNYDVQPSSILLDVLTRTLTYRGFHF